MLSKNCSSWIPIACMVLPAAAFAQDPIPYQVGMVLRSGWDSRSSTVKQECLVGTPQEESQVTSDYRFDEVGTKSDLYAYTGLSASTFVGMAGFTGSAAVSAVRSATLTSYDLNMVARNIVTVRSTTLVDGQLKPEFETLRSQDPEAFRKACGDRYIKTILYGGELYGLVVSQVVNRSEKIKLEAALRAEYGVGTSSGAVSAEHKKVFDETATSVSIFDSGNPAAVPSTPDEFKTYVANFKPNVVTEKGVPVSVILNEYPGAPVPSLPAATVALITTYWEFVTVADEGRFVKSRFDQFYTDGKPYADSSWRPIVEGVIVTATDWTQKIESSIKRCIQDNDPSACAGPLGVPSPDDLRKRLPPRYMGRCEPVTWDWPPPASKPSVFPLVTYCPGERGNDDFDGHGPEISIASRALVEDGGKQFNIRSNVVMRATPGDKTCFMGSSTITALMLDPLDGCFLKDEGDLEPRRGTLSAVRPSGVFGERTYSSGQGLVLAATCVADTSGDDWGKVGCNTIELRPITVRPHHIEETFGANKVAERAFAAGLVHRAKVRANLARAIESVKAIRMGSGTCTGGNKASCNYVTPPLDIGIPLTSKWSPNLKKEKGRLIPP